MTEITLLDLQASVQDRSAFNTLADYSTLCEAFLTFVQRTQLTRIVSPTYNNYVFHQYDEAHGYRITRPLNTHLFIERVDDFKAALDRFILFLSDLRRYQEAIADQESVQRYLKRGEVNRVVYTVQQAIGSIGDSFENPNQCRKRIGQLFETLIKLIIQEVGLECEPRTIIIPIPGYPGYEMSYELDLVFSRNKAIVAAETKFIDLTEIVGSVKTTSGLSRIIFLVAEASAPFWDLHSWRARPLNIGVGKMKIAIFAQQRFNCATPNACSCTRSLGI